MSDRLKGLYDKYVVVRSDGRSAEDKKHHGCAYFVIDRTHDRFATPALIAYAMACRIAYPQLAEDIMVGLPCEHWCVSRGPDAVCSCAGVRVLSLYADRPR